MKIPFRRGLRFVVEAGCALSLLFGSAGCESISSSQERAYDTCAWEDYTVYVLWWAMFGVGAAFGGGEGCINFSPGR